MLRLLEICSDETILPQYMQVCGTVKEDEGRDEIEVFLPQNKLRLGSRDPAVMCSFRWVLDLSPQPMQEHPGGCSWGAIAGFLPPLCPQRSLACCVSALHPCHRQAFWTKKAGAGRGGGGGDSTLKSPGVGKFAPSH